MNDFMKTKRSKPTNTGTKQRMYESKEMPQDTFTPEGVPVSSPLNYGMMYPENWQTKENNGFYEKRKQKSVA